MKPTKTPSTAWQFGFDQGFEGRDFFNPCAGNPYATADHHAGYLIGKAAREAYADLTQEG